MIRYETTTAAQDDWARCVDGLTARSLRALMNADVAAVRLAGFASAAECERFCAAIQTLGGARSSAAVTAQMTLLGVNFSNCVGADRAGYFEQVDDSYRAVQDVYALAGFDPLARMLERLRAVWPCSVGVAAEPGHGRYFAGGIKTRTATGNLHYDYTPHSANGYRIADIVDQIGWNLYLEMPRDTGHTVLHGRPVPREGGALGAGKARALNVDRAYVEGAPKFAFQPRVGDVVLINTRCPHDIIVENTRHGELRAQVSSFIGRMDDDALVLWS